MYELSGPQRGGDCNKHQECCTSGANSPPTVTLGKVVHVLLVTVTEVGSKTTKELLIAGPMEHHVCTYKTGELFNLGAMN